MDTVYFSQLITELKEAPNQKIYTKPIIDFMKEVN
jgi:hypothetical protein